MSLAEKLYNIGAIKFGSFQLKSGITSPIYIDLRLIISHPELLKEMSDTIWSKAKDLKFDLICGVPYTALPLATALSITHNLPMLMKRKEMKAYGTKKMIEGVFHEGQTCLLVEDIITSGGSIFETIDPLQNEGIIVRDLIVVIDREQGGRKRLEEKGYIVHSLLTLSEILTELETKGKISAAVVSDVKNFLSGATIK